MIKAFYKVQEKDYTMLQKLVTEKFTEMKNTSTDDIDIINKPNDKVFERE